MTFKLFKGSKGQEKPVVTLDGENVSHLFEQNDENLNKVSSLSLQQIRQRLNYKDVGSYPFSRLFAWLQMFMVRILKMGPVPRHLSFIMDGNRRYAKKLDQPVKEGHRAGGATLIDILHICRRLNVSSVSAYAFSIENFNRSPQEVATLMELLGYYIDQFTERATNAKDELYGIRLRVVGDLSLLSEELLKKIRNAEKLTRDGQEFVLYLALPYTSRNDIAHSMQVTIDRCINSNEDITEQALTDNMYFEEYSSKCDLLIRTSGHTRLSDYMLWQVHEGSIIEFVDCLWPDFNFWRLYWIMLKWSFYQTWQNASQLPDPVRTRTRVFPKISGALPIETLKRTKRVALDSLPAAPLAVSVDRK
ncbi:Srt1 [Kluyveromyces lactis]|nr:Srt1 [Kluyveromyces lactis]